MPQRQCAATARECGPGGGLSISQDQIGLALRENNRSTRYFESIEVSKELADRGWTSDVVAQRVTGAIRDVQQSSGILKRQAEFITDWDKLDLQLPGQTLSIENAARLVRTALGGRVTRLRG